MKAPWCDSRLHARVLRVHGSGKLCRWQCNAGLIDIFDPHAIVIGGGVGNCAVLYSDALRVRLSTSIFAPSFEAAILRPAMGDSAGVFGAALLTRPDA